jgi:hypothetical protein
MASTGGGFLLGFGLCLLLMSLLAGFMATEVYGKLERSRSDIERLYSITHSSEYQYTLTTLDTLSGVVNRIRNALCNPLISWMGLCGISDTLDRGISGAVSFMREVQSVSEELYYAITAMPMVMQLLWITSLIGLAMIGAGIALIIRARRKEKAIKT